MNISAQGNLHNHEYSKVTLVLIVKQSRNGEQKISIQCHVDLAIYIAVT